MPSQKPMWTRCLGGFSVMWVTKLLISQVKKRIFCPKATKFGPKLAFLVNLGQAMQAYSVPCWWVVWWLWRAGCISQDTYLLYVFVPAFNIYWSEYCILNKCFRRRANVNSIVTLNITVIMIKLVVIEIISNFIFTKPTLGGYPKLI